VVKITYQLAGVDIDQAQKAKEQIKELVSSTFRPEVLSNFGSFGGLFALKLTQYQQPVLVSSIDSVGTKIKIATMMNKHTTIGQDIVAHCVNDILVQGAEPLFFLDYLGLGKMNPVLVKEIIQGISAACQVIDCSLIGGETAELPGFYPEGDYDLVGCIVGLVEKKKIITGEKIQPGDVVIGLPASGLHTNGYSLARKIFFEKMKCQPDTYLPELKTTVGEELLKPHRCYLKLLLPLLKKGKIKGLAHLTGGGFLDNIPRILPAGVGVKIFKGTWEILPVFKILQREGELDEKEMFRTFNLGIGMVVITSPYHQQEVVKRTSGKIIGEVVKSRKKIRIC
jgi:phosphoribosylformylglycinamidine cyclo-ligase